MTVAPPRSVRRTSPAGRARRCRSFSRTWQRAGAAALLAFAPLTLLPSVQAASKSYHGADQGDWDTAANWTGGLPGTSDTAANTSANTVVHSQNVTDTINSLLFTGLGGLNLSDGILAGAQASDASTFEVDNNFTMSGGTLRNFTINKGGGGGVLTATSGTLDGDVVNLSKIDLTTGGRLQSVNSTFASGTNFSLDNGAALSFQGATTLTGDTVTLANTATTDPDYLAIDGANSSLTLASGTTVSGAGRVGGGFFTGGSNNTTLTNAGTVSANASGKTLTLSPDTLVNTGTIQAMGGGLLSFDTATLTNSGTISSAGTLLSLGYGAVTNTGTIRATGAGGNVSLGGTLANAGGAITLGAGSVFTLGGTVTGGALTGGTLTGSGTLRNVAASVGAVSLSASTLLVDNSGSGGSFAVTGGAIGLDNGAALSFQGAQTLTGATVTLANTATTDPDYLAIDGANSSLTLAANTTVSGAGQVGTAYFVGGSNRTLTNAGTISANAAGKTLSIIPDAFVNSGTIQAINGGTLALSATSTTDTGTIFAAAGSTVTVSTDLTQSGAAARTVADGTFTVNGGTGTLTVAGGVLGGGGTINGSVVNSGGVVSPGDSPGTLAITGSYTQGANGALTVEYTASSAPNFTPAHDLLTVSGTATLGGLLNVSFLGPNVGGQYLATPGENGTTFDFLTFGTLGNANGLAGLFSNEYGSAASGFFVNGVASNGTSAGPAVYRLSFDPGNSKALQLSLTTTAAPEPSQWAAFGLGTLGLGGLALRRRRLAR